MYNAAQASMHAVPPPAGGGPGPAPTVAATGAISSNSNATGCTVATSGTPSAGNIVLVLIFVVDGSGGANSTITPPSGHGFASVDSGLSTDNNAKCLVFWKRWGAGDTDNTSMAFTGTTGNCRGVALTIAGAKASGTPFSAGEHAGAGSSSAGTTGTAPSVTTDAANRLLLRVFVGNAGSGANVSAVSDTAVFSGASYAWTAGVDGQSACGRSTPSAGATGTGTCTFTASASWAAVSVAIDPEPAS